MYCHVVVVCKLHLTIEGKLILDLHLLCCCLCIVIYKVETDTLELDSMGLWTLTSWNSRYFGNVAGSMAPAATPKYQEFQNINRGKSPRIQSDRSLKLIFQLTIESKLYTAQHILDLCLLCRNVVMVQEVWRHNNSDQLTLIANITLTHRYLNCVCELCCIGVKSSKW